ncbi:MAG: hypothetical protein KC478_14615 [Bacteriovoracaceae bacterium]|nr:hypothetical protein [Bacteriovoracaceae bacterium]
MLGIVLKSSIAFSVSYIVLSFQVNNTYIFDHLNNITGPVGENIQMVLSKSFSQTWNTTKTYGKQMFTSSEPDSIEATIEDSVDKTQSAIKRQIAPVKKPVESYLEELRKEERDGLSRIIMEND